MTVRSRTTVRKAAQSVKIKSNAAKAGKNGVQKQKQPKTTAKKNHRRLPTRPQSDHAAEPPKQQSQTAKNQVKKTPQQSDDSSTTKQQSEMSHNPLKIK